MEIPAGLETVRGSGRKNEGVDLPVRAEAAARAVLAALCVLAAHAASIDSGLYLDDHAHYEHLRNYDWSFRSAVESSRLGIVGEVMDLWGRREAGLIFFRPIAFWLMKIEYSLVGFEPAAMHVFSLTWHWLCCLLVGALTTRLIGNARWGTLAACIAAVHPGHVGTVQWVACQTELMCTAFVVAAVLAHARASRWARPVLPVARPETSPAALEGGARGVWALLAVALYALALGCRENSVLLPVVCWAGDRLCRARVPGWFRPIYLVYGGIFLGYFLLRYHMLGGFPLPARPYLTPVTDPDFPFFALQKTAMYLMGLFMFIPIVPIGGNLFFVEHWFLLVAGVSLIVLLLVLVWWRYRWSGGFLWLAFWMACFFAPVMPVFASVHHLYLPGVAAAAALALALAVWWGVMPEVTAAAWRRITCLAAMIWLGVLMGAITFAMTFTFTRGTMVEDVLLEEVKRRGGPVREGDRLFFLNMPMLSYYAIPALRAHFGYRELEGHVLTFAPDLLGMRTPASLEVLDAHTLRVTAGGEDRYLQGITGQMLLGVMALERQIQEGRPIDAGLFTVTPTRVDPGGVRQLVFRFHEPLTRPGYHFYWGSPLFLAYPLNMAELVGAQGPAPSVTTYER